MQIPSENLIGTLEQTIALTRSAQNRLSERLKDVELEISKLESEAAQLNDEIQALEHSATQTEQAMKSLKATLGNK